VKTRLQSLGFHKCDWCRCASVVLVGALRLNVRGEGKVFQTAMNGCTPLCYETLNLCGGAGAPFEVLDGSAAVNDGVIAALMVGLALLTALLSCVKIVARQNTRERHR
jgi:hypothetical protein